LPAATTRRSTHRSDRTAQFELITRTHIMHRQAHILHDMQRMIDANKVLIRKLAVLESRLDEQVGVFPVVPVSLL
jgi:hypothetical protein